MFTHATRVRRYLGTPPKAVVHEWGRQPVTTHLNSECAFHQCAPTKFTWAFIDPVNLEAPYKLRLDTCDYATPSFNLYSCRMNAHAFDLSIVPLLIS